MNKQNKECIFYIVRHGETEWNKKHILQGQKDSLLTFEGINQAKKIAIMFKKIKFDQIFSSDLIRCRWTAEIIALEHKIIVKTNKLLRELRFGRFEGKKYQEFRDELKEQIELREKLSKNERFCFRLADSVETEEEAMGSFITFLRELALVYPSKKILIVTHGGIVRSLNTTSISRSGSTLDDIQSELRQLRRDMLAKAPITIHANAKTSIVKGRDLLTVVEIEQRSQNTRRLAVVPG